MVHPSGGSLKTWGARCAVQTLCSSERSWELEVPSQLYGGRVYGKCVSAFPDCFYVGIFSFAQCVAGVQLVSGFLSEGISSSVAVHLVHQLEDGCSGAYCGAILVNSTSFRYF